MVVACHDYPLVTCKVAKPVPPRATAKVPDETDEALRLDKLAPEPVKVFAEISPVAVIVVVLIPPKAYIIPLNDVLIARE